MFKKILIADDLTIHPSNMIGHFPDHTLGIEEVILAHVLNATEGFRLDDDSRRRLDAKLSDRSRKLEEMGFNCHPELVTGVPGRVILELAEKHNVSVVMIGSHHRGGLRGSLIGSVSYSILHETTRPTFLVRFSPETDSTGEFRPEAGSGLNILYPTDFSEIAEVAFLYLERIATATGASVTIYHVHDKARIDPYLRDKLPEFDREDRARMEHMKNHLETNGSGPCTIQLSYGVPVQRLLKLAKSGEYNLMIMGTQGRGYIPEIFLGSTANAVARHAPLPVLFIPRYRAGMM